MANINLLPPELEPKGKYLKLIKTLRRLAFISVSAFILLAAIMGVFLFILGRQYSNALKTQEKLKSEIQALSQTEQQLILQKDRLAKIDVVLKISSARQEIEALASNSSLLPPGVKVKDVRIDSGIAEISFNSPDLNSISSLLAIIVNQTSYKKIELLHFEFKPLEGYIMTLAFET